MEADYNGRGRDMTIDHEKSTMYGVMITVCKVFFLRAFSAIHTGWRYPEAWTHESVASE